MSDMGDIASQKLKMQVYSFYKALTNKNIDEIKKLFNDNAILSWGPYKFVGKENIIEWVRELWELFPQITVQEKSIGVYGTIVKHEFVLAFTTQEGRNGWLPCEGIYRFRDGSIIQLDVKLLHGYVAVNKDEIERVKPHPIR